MIAPRKDAARNRAKLVDAARHVFAERGLGATLDEVAERAGVGTGTAYRNFRDKHELAAEVLAESTAQIATDAADALRVDDPWLAIVTFFENTAARQAADRGLYQALAGQGRAADKVRLWPQIVGSVTALFDRAKQAGVVRDDLQPEDAVAVLAMLGALNGGPAGPDHWRRYLTLVLDGARAVDQPPLPETAGRYHSIDDVITVTKSGRAPTR